MQMVEDLKKEHLPIKEFIPTVDAKAEAYNYLLRIMQDGNLTINSKDQKLQFQLRTFKYEISETGKMKLHHETEYSGDDFTDSFCYAVWVTKQQFNYVPVIAFGAGRRE